MLNVSKKQIHLNKLLSMSAAGLLLVTQASTCLGQSPVNKQGLFEFEAVDIDGDDQLGWTELSHPYDDAFSAAGWSQEQVFSQFDQDSNNALDPDEYQAFTASLQKTLAANQGLATNESEGFGASDPDDEGWFEFDDVEANNDDSVSWTELNEAYGDRISQAGWDEQQVLNQFDQNNNDTLDENEYQEFTSSLQSTLAANQGLATNESEGLGASDPDDEGWFEFDDVEADNDDRVTWSELDETYGDQLSQVGWDEQQVMDRFDENRSGALEENEYLLLIGDLQTAQEQQGQMAASGVQQGQNAQDTTGQMQVQEQQYQAQQGQGQAQQNQQAQAQAQQGQQDQDPALGQQDQADAIVPVAVITILTVDEAPQDISLEELEDRQVVNMEGEEIGEVEDVVRSTVGTETGLVVSVGGFWDIGDQDTYFSLDQFRLQGDQLVLQTQLDADAIEEADQFAYDEQNYTSLIDEYQAGL